MSAIFLEGGFFMWPLLFMTLIGLALVMERSAALVREKRSGDTDPRDPARAHAAGELSSARLRQRMAWLLALARLLPSTGLLGSLIGALSAATAISKAGNVEMRILAAGVAEMLIPVTAGLLVGILLHIAHTALAAAADKQL